MKPKPTTRNKNKRSVAMTIIEMTKFDTQRKTKLSAARKIEKFVHRGLVIPTKLKQRIKDEATDQRTDEKKGLVAGAI